MTDWRDSSHCKTQDCSQCQSYWSNLLQQYTDWPDKWQSSVFVSVHVSTLKNKKYAHVVCMIARDVLVPACLCNCSGGGIGVWQRWWWRSVTKMMMVECDKDDDGGLKNYCSIQNSQIAHSELRRRTTQSGEWKQTKQQIRWCHTTIKNKTR